MNFIKIENTPKFGDIVSIDNLLQAWKEFLPGKRKKRDVQIFELHLMDNILELHRDLKNFSYRHGGYKAFNISDPKPRNIHKASVRDRLLHHAIYRMLYPFFDRKFIADSYSCRMGKGTHKALNRFRKFGYKISKNNTKTCWVLKCDIRKFFANINHSILENILLKNIKDGNILWLFGRIIESFSTRPGVGLPLGNLTSQLLVNIYMNELDQFVKHKLKIKYYIRYADDFVLFLENKSMLLEQIEPIEKFLADSLKLELHPDKVSIQTFASGLDFLGWVNFPSYRILRTITKRRMLKRIEENSSEATRNSYLGLLKHGNAHKLISKIF